MNAEDFNDFRKNYGVWTFDELKAFYDRMAKDHPEQNHYHGEAVAQFFAQIPEESFTVAELGGWDGALAAEILAKEPRILSWTNYEIASVAPVCTDRRYRQPELKAQPFARLGGMDVVVASHSLEHLNADDLWSFLWWLNAGTCKHVYIDMPRCEGGHQDATASHALVMSHENVLEWFKTMTFACIEEMPGKKGDSTVNWFRRDS